MSSGSLEEQSFINLVKHFEDELAKIMNGKPARALSKGIGARKIDDVKASVSNARARLDARAQSEPPQAGYSYTKLQKERYRESPATR